MERRCRSAHRLGTGLIRVNPTTGLRKTELNGRASGAARKLRALGDRTDCAKEGSTYVGDRDRQRIRFCVRGSALPPIETRTVFHAS
jgi:hypothetical protein